MADALSIEQNNKIRAALGLPPLPVPGSTDGPVFKPSKGGDSSSDEDDEPGSTLESRAAQGYDNWKKAQDEQEAQKKRQATKEAIKRAREAAQRTAKLEGKGLGDAGDAEMDTKAWLMQHKKKQRKIEKERARKLAEELAERERLAAVEYTSKDLAGVTVGHEIGDFDEAGEQILTLKDNTIDDDENADELENVFLKERERTKEKLDLKKKKPVYDPNDMDASGSILAQYDEEIDGKKTKHFTLDAKDITPAQREANRQGVSSKMKVHSLDISDLAQTEATPSDYMDISEIKVKKPKKKKSKSTRRKAADDDAIFPEVDNSANGTSNDQSNGDSMEVDGAPKIEPRKRTHEDMAFVDDDDLQASLATQRRAAFKKRKKVRPEDLARQLREESEDARNEMEVDNKGEEEDGPGLVIDETSEFVSSLQKPVLLARQESPTPHAKEESPEKDITAKVEDVEDTEDVDMEKSYNDIEDDEDLQARLEQEKSGPGMTATGLEEETTLDQGLGSTLSMLKQRGLVTAADGASKNSTLRDRQRFLVEKKQRETDAERRARTQRERDRTSGKLDRMSARDREEYARWENKQRDQQESRITAEIFNREYKPDVNLNYVDEFGRQMSQKEAFKELSHQFHGKGSGKMKTEKRLKKIEDEKKRESMSTLDSSQHTGMNNAMGATARRNRQAGVRLA